METNEKIKAARENLGLSQADLAAAIGISQPAVKKIESGETRKSKYLTEIIDFLGIDDERRVNSTERAPVEFLGKRDLPIFSAVEGGPGEMVVSTEPIEIVPRPWYMRNVKDGYGVVVIGESMEPKFGPNDIVIVNPRLPALRSRPAIFIADEETGGFTATVKLLIRETASEWHVLQFNPPPGSKKEFVLPKKRWTRALRIVGTYEGS